MSVRIDENTDHMKYTDDMEAIDSDIMDRVIAEMNSYDADIYTAKDVKEALAAETCSVDNFKALLSPAAKRNAGDRRDRIGRSFDPDWRKSKQIKC